MTIWDSIYKDYQAGGEAWATLSENIHPLFKNFLSQSDFSLSHVLDIGCGDGKYLSFLQAKGFKTDGIDSSQTAVKTTKNNLNNKSKILCTDMFDYIIPEDKYDLIISISTIHHGMKKQVKSLINRIYESLTPNGKIFITVPDFYSAEKNNSLKDHEEISEGTFISVSGPEKGLPHSFYTKYQAQKLFTKFSNLKLDLDEIGRWVIQASK